MSDTPRTDELELNFQRDNLDTHLKLVLALRFAEKLERENAALREQVEHLIGMIEQLESDLARFATVEAFEGKKEAQS